MAEAAFVTCSFIGSDQPHLDWMMTRGIQYVDSMDFFSKKLYIYIYRKYRANGWPCANIKGECSIPQMGPQVSFPKISTRQISEKRWKAQESTASTPSQGDLIKDMIFSWVNVKSQPLHYLEVFCFAPTKTAAPKATTLPTKIGIGICWCRRWCFATLSH